MAYLTSGAKVAAELCRIFGIDPACRVTRIEVTMKDASRVYFEKLATAEELRAAAKLLKESGVEVVEAPPVVGCLDCDSTVGFRCCRCGKDYEMPRHRPAARDDGGLPVCAACLRKAGLESIDRLLGQPRPDHVV